MDAALDHAFGICAAPLTDRLDFASPRVAALWAWWAAEAQRDGLVRWAAFDIVAHADLAPYLFIIHRVPDGFERRLYGEEARQTLGLDCRVREPRIGPGHPVPAGWPQAFGPHLHAYYSQVLAGRAAWRRAGHLPFAQRTHVRFESLDLPVARGAEPDTILGLIDRVG